MFNAEHCLNPNQLAVVESANTPNIRSYYIQTYEDQEIIYAGYYQVLNVKPIHFNHKIKCVQKYALDISLRMVRPSLLVAGNLFRHDAVYHCFAKNLKPEEKATIFLQSTEHLMHYTKATGVFLKDVPHDFALCVQSDTTFKQMTDDISMQLDIPAQWQSLEDYQKALKHKYTQRFKKITQQLDGIKIRELTEAEIQEYKQDMHNLYLQVTQNQLVSMGILSADFFVEMKKQIGNRYRVCGWFLDNRLVAFSSAIVHDGIYDMNYIGFDYKLNQSHAIYFNILFHCLEQAICTRSSKLILGRTALEAKAILGCEAAYQYGFYKLRHPLVNWFFKKISTGFREQQGDKWKDRHPFKSSHYGK